MKQNLASRPGSKLLSVWVPRELVPLLDEGVRREDTDRSKFIRNAIREKLGRQGIGKGAGKRS